MFAFVLSRKEVDRIFGAGPVGGFAFVLLLCSERKVESAVERIPVGSVGQGRRIASQRGAEVCN